MTGYVRGSEHIKFSYLEIKKLKSAEDMKIKIS